MPVPAAQPMAKETAISTPGKTLSTLNACQAAAGRMTPAARAQAQKFQYSRLPETPCPVRERERSYLNDAYDEANMRCRLSLSIVYPPPA